MNVSEIMTTAPITVSRDTPVNEVARLISERQVSGVPVVEADGTLVGMVTEEDLIVRNANLHLPTVLTFLDGLIPLRGQHKFKDELRHVLATRADEVMREHLYTIGADTDVADAATLMIDKHVNPLPVVEDGRLVGVLSRVDIVRLMVRLDAASSGPSSDAAATGA